MVSYNCLADKGSICQKTMSETRFSKQMIYFSYTKKYQVTMEPQF